MSPRDGRVRGRVAVKMKKDDTLLMTPAAVTVKKMFALFFWLDLHPLGTQNHCDSHILDKKSIPCHWYYSQC